MQLSDAYAEFVLAHDYQPAARRYYHERLGRFQRWLSTQIPPITTVERLSTTIIRRYLDERKTLPSEKTGKLLDSYTLHSTARAILAWLNWLVEEGLLDASVPKRIKAPRREQKVLQVLDKRQIDRLFLAAENGPLAIRDKALLSVLLDTGLRANELCSLTRGDVTVTPDDAYLLVRKGKGRRQREVPLGKKARLALARHLRSHTAASVFGLTPSGVDQALYRLYEKAGKQHYLGLKLGAHLFRHTFAVRYLEAGGDIYKLSRIMGHSQITTTEGYLRAVTARMVRQGGVSPLDSLGA